MMYLLYLVQKSHDAYVFGYHVRVTPCVMRSGLTVDQTTIFMFKKDHTQDILAWKYCFGQVHVELHLVASHKRRGSYEP